MVKMNWAGTPHSVADGEGPADTVRALGPVSPAWRHGGSPTLAAMFSGFAHAALCVPDVEEAVRWYSEVLGLTVLSPPYLMEGEAIERDMAELVPPPVAVKAAIVGLGDDDHVIELIEYPNAGISASPAVPSVTRYGLTHVGLVCDDVARTRSELEARGVEFLVSGVADVARLKTTWFSDPWGTVFILLEKQDAARPYWRQLDF
jgi:catechol 2,3-dioxygenase-like lactoylglutathione lyase family enzyme